MNEVVKFIEDHKVLVICRGYYGETLLKSIDALYNGGIRMTEVTFDQSDPDAIVKTTDAIRLIKEHFPDMKVGSGTVTCIDHVLATKYAGGEFCLSPNVNIDVIKKTKEVGLVSIPGAMTPSEILTAHDAGADLVKIFPAGWLGLHYLKDIKGPINHVKFLATAGVNEENFGTFLQAGYCGAGISSRLLDKKSIQENNFDELTRRAQIFTKIANEN
ncbi:bifunctional 4-hydroxy-2-oxoglutarate aldolase/2-dehydro-3-deoxy-phosphogluconate aldolase [Absicoccus intestinalis]|uniref:Bifunctional 4-hydroxy-2-oxoglutarate aldolase/2-dehydro-3-deoxy-phosphogluconate aldolase n=1 Tax=Absicoccus intestinalis TaxID=2926319 RepID=A0ABU4WLB4_9FIRM|nr:bifunctional 4-hydroxy-2-oxoglutarate aldolase/2-dehydro-3-deoxy-phosphogluconate aldolase [Absicoccus sp. CLA-KB-P134]MDX8417321.1 bifunctional 4-hydroxy-2-oxoglutarate aldolase/2-dehydro-3-deoxy-phosphogluconate aldolase [Absicoccus sp. CLA-KB-P134]